MPTFRIRPFARLLICALLSALVLPLAAQQSEPTNSDVGPVVEPVVDPVVEPIVEPVGPLAEADALWERRAEGAADGRARPEPIAAAVAAYEKAYAADPTHLEAAWKLLRALHFQGDYATDEREAKQAIFERGREVMEAALNQLGERVGGREALDEMVPEKFAEVFPEPEVAKIYFWGAINWGLWGEVFSKMKAARQGVAGRLRDYAVNVIAAAPEYEDGGGYRLLGRLHTEAPKIIFVTGWIDRDLAISSLRDAVRVGPNDPYNQFYLADALIKYDASKKAEALEILERLKDVKPRVDKPVGDAYILGEARKLLAGQRP